MFRRVHKTSGRDNLEVKTADPTDRKVFSEYRGKAYERLRQRWAFLIDYRLTAGSPAGPRSRPRIM